jgi:hypothetical protein
MGLERLSCAGLDQERLEHVLDPLRRAEDSLHSRAPAPAGDDREIARPRLARALTVDDYRRAEGEVRLADQQLAAPGKLDDERF